MAGLPAPQPGEEVVVETRRREVVEDVPGGRGDADEEHRGGAEGEAEPTKDELLDRAQELNVRGRSTMTKEELSRAVSDAEEDQEFR